MNNDTKAKFAAILAAAQNKQVVDLKPASQPNSKPATIQAAPAPTPAPAPEAITAPLPEAPAPKVEMSAFTFDSLINDLNKPQAPAPAPVAKTTAPATPAPAPAPEVNTVDINPANAPQVLNFTVVDYSEKAFAVIGDTKDIKDQLGALGGRYNPRLKCGKGWIFSKKRRAQVDQLLASI